MEVLVQTGPVASRAHKSTCELFEFGEEASVPGENLHMHMHIKLHTGRQDPNSEDYMM